MSARARRLAPAAAALTLALSGCGGLPRPFQENPGADALALAAPPPLRLAVVPPEGALLPRGAGPALAHDVAAALDDREVPAEAIRPVRGDWRLVTTARAGADGRVTPVFTVFQPSGKLRGATDGAPVDAGAWARADPATLQAAADDATPRIAELLTGIQAAVRQADPNSLMHRPARVAFEGVSGAPGDGNASLEQALRASLPQQGDQLDPPGGAPPDYVVRAVVAVSTPKDGRQMVEIDWHVADARGHEAGKVSQLNAVPAHALDGAWGQIALAAASEAATGIHEVIRNNAGVNDKPVAPPAA